MRHDRPQDFSKVFKDISFFNSAYFQDPKLQLPVMGLTINKAQIINPWPEVEYIARAKENNFSKDKLPFEFWWEKHIVLDDLRGNKYTRKSLVLNYAYHNLRQKLVGIYDPAIINSFQYSGFISDYNSDTGILTIKGKVFRQTKELQNSKIFSEDLLLLENIRGISGEISETFKSSFLN